MKLFCYIYRDCELLPHFFKHYDALGITEYYFIVNTKGTPGLEETVRAYSKGRDVRVQTIHTAFVSKEKDEVLERLKNRHTTPEEWIFVVDLDEFVEFFAPIDELMHTCEKSGQNVIYGKFADRVSADGHLRKIRTKVPIEEQFPLTCDLTEKIIHGWTYKSAFRKASIRIWNCCHEGEDIVWDGIYRARINHYKWKEGVLERLEERVEEFKAQNMSWWKESQNFLDYHQKHDRINLEDKTLNIRKVSDPVFCTITDTAYLHQTIALYESLLKYNPDVRLHVLVTDSDDDFEYRNIVFYKLNDVADHAGEIITKYQTSGKLRWALKAVFLEYLLSEKEDRVIYVDNDIYFFSDYDFLFDLLKTESVLLTPHWRNIDFSGNFSRNLTNGLYNAGFFAANKGGLEAITWWKKWCEFKMEQDLPNGFYDDQKYLDLIPAYFNRVHVIKHKGCNVAFWNKEFNERVVTKNGVLIDGQWPIVFIHFTTPLHDKSKSFTDIEPVLRDYAQEYQTALEAAKEKLGR